MSPVGHTLTGVALGYIALPVSSTKRAALAFLGLPVLFANVPDAPLPSWGHDRYDISHSVFTTSLGVLLLAALAACYPRRFHPIPRRLTFAIAAAWFSHLLLDTLYNHGQGLAIFWPFSTARVALPIPWFSTLQVDEPLCTHNLQVMSIEAAAYGLPLATVILIKRRGLRA